jgi:hypothetical protein
MGPSPASVLAARVFSLQFGQYLLRGIAAYVLAIAEVETVYT